MHSMVGPYGVGAMGKGDTDAYFTVCMLSHMFFLYFTESICFKYVTLNLSGVESGNKQTYGDKNPPGTLYVTLN